MNTELSFYKRCSFPQWAATLGSVLEYYQNYMITSTMNTVTKDSSEQCCVWIWSPILLCIDILTLNGTIAQNCSQQIIQRECLCVFQTKTMIFRCLQKENIQILCIPYCDMKQIPCPHTPLCVWYCRNLVGDDWCWICWCIVDWYNAYSQQNTIQSWMLCELCFCMPKWCFSYISGYLKSQCGLTGPLWHWNMCVRDANATCCDKTEPLAWTIGWDEPSWRGKGCCSSATWIVTLYKYLSPILKQLHQKNLSFMVWNWGWIAP